MADKIRNRIKVASLIRTSTNNQIASIQSQYNDIDTALLKFDLDDVINFELIGIKQTDIPFSRQYKRLFSLLKEGVISGVVVSDISRIIWKSSLRSVNILQQFIDIDFKIFTRDLVIDSKNVDVNYSGESFTDDRMYNDQSPLPYCSYQGSSKLIY